MDFSSALKAIKSGQRVRRTGWNGKGMWVELQQHAESNNSVLPQRLSYLILIYPAGSTAYPNGAIVPWLASQTDILAEDWELV